MILELNLFFFDLKYPRSDKTPFQRFQDNEVTEIFKSVNKLLKEHPNDANLKNDVIDDLFTS